MPGAAAGAEGEQQGSAHGPCSGGRAARKRIVPVLCFSSQVHSSLRSLQRVLLYTDSESGKNYLVCFFSECSGSSESGQFGQEDEAPMMLFWKESKLRDCNSKLEETEGSGPHSGL